MSFVILVWCASTPSALAHLERTSYWPDPSPDTSVTPPAGGAVPVARTLKSSLSTALPGRTRVVCKRDSLRRALASIRRARKAGYRLRPTLPVTRLTRKQARSRERLSRALFERCRFRDIQAAVLRSANNDRVVVMPGVYLEQPSRAQPTEDPRCAGLHETNAFGEPGATSYRYQVACPNDQSLIYVQGRALSAQLPPSPPPRSRFGIPDEGPCLRCNLQIEGAGVTPLDVVVDAAADPSAGLRARVAAAKDVVLRADRADGLVVKNLTTAHAREHGVYIHETDGYLVDDFKAFYNGLYGALLFTSDHGLTRDCELVGHQDSGVYPGGTPDTAAQRIEPHARLNQTVTRCDLHHNATGYSANMGNAVRVVDNDIYDNTTGLLNVSLFPAGHPGYPQDSAVFEDNDIYSNNFDSYAPGSDVVPAVAVPIGVGILIIGGNDNVIRRNRMWDNRRRGAMQAALPDVFAEADNGRLIGSTSHRNRYYENVMGVAPDGTRAPNGLDFWWDDAPGNKGNCWYANGAIRSEPPRLPSACNDTSLGLTYLVHFAELLPCLAEYSSGGRDPRACTWFRVPPPPAGTSASAGVRTRAAASGDRHIGPISPCSISATTSVPCNPLASSPLAGATMRALTGSRGSFTTPERLQVATCQDWAAAGDSDRRDAIDTITAMVAGPLLEGRTLDAAEAHDALDVPCRNPLARGFLLYELYNRAVAFTTRDPLR